jgi:hypothetical protein
MRFFQPKTYDYLHTIEPQFRIPFVIWFKTLVNDEGSLLLEV